MTLKERLQHDLVEALKQGAYERRSTLAMVHAAVKNKEIEKGKKEAGLSESEIVEVLGSEAKRRRDAASEDEKASRPELAEKERAELAIIEAYLPIELSQGEIRAELEAVIAEVGTSSKKDFGRIMGLAAKRLKGRAGGARIKEELEKLLT